MGCEMEKPVSQPVPLPPKKAPSRHFEPQVENEFMHAGRGSAGSPVPADDDSYPFGSSSQHSMEVSATKPIEVQKSSPLKSELVHSIKSVQLSPKEYKHTFKSKMQAADSLEQIAVILASQLDSNPVYNVILSKEYIIQMAESYKQTHMTHSQINSLNTLLLAYLARSLSEVHAPSSTQQLKEFSMGLGKDWQQLRTQINTDRKNILQILDFLARKREGEVRIYQQCLLDLKMDLNPDEVRIVCEVVLRMMRLDWKAVYFFTVYLELAALHLQRHNLSLIQINKRIKKAVSLAGTLSGVPYTREEEGEIIRKHPSFKTREYQKEYVEIKDLDNKNKMFILNDFIRAKAEQTVAAFQSLKNCVEPVCTKYSSHFESSTYQGGTIDMVKARQKFLDAAVEQINLQDKLRYDPQYTIAQQVRAQLANYEKQLGQIIGLLNQDVEVKIAHFVTFTCWFKTFDKMNECADELKQAIESEKAQLLEVQNRLKSVVGVSEIVFKILMKEVRFQVHLVFEYNLPRLIFKQKIDFIASEKAFSCLTAIQLTNKTMGQKYFSELYQTVAATLLLPDRNASKETPISFEVAERQLSQLGSLLPFELDLEPPIDDEEQFFWEQKKRFLKVLSEMTQEENVNVNQFPYQKRCRNGRFKETMGEFLVALTEYEKSCQDYRILREERNKRSVRNLNKSSIVVQMSVGLLGKSSIMKEDGPKLTGKPLEAYSFGFSLLRAGKLNFGKGNYEKAIEYYLECAQVCEKKNSSAMRRLLAEAQASIGLCEFKKGYYRKAIDCFQKCFRALPQHLPKQQNLRLILQKHISQVLREQGVNHQALKYNEKCLLIVRKEWGQGSMQMVQLMDFNVDMFQTMGDVEAALEEQQSILEIIANRIGKNTIEYAQHLKRRGQLLVKEQSWQKSIEMYQRSLRIKEHIHGLKTIHFVEDLLLAAESHKILERYDHAIEGLKTCAAILEPDRARKFNELISIYTKIGQNLQADLNYPEALKYYLLSMHIHEKFKQKNGNDYAALLQNVARIHTRLRNSTEAEKYSKAAQRFKAKQQSTGPIDQFHNLSKIAQKTEERGNYPLSLKYLNRCLELLQGKKGSGTLQENELLKRMGRIYRIQGQTTRAIQLLDRCLQIIRQSKGEDNFEYAEIYAQLGQAFEEVQDYAQARDNYKCAIGLCQKYKIKYHTYAYSSHGLANTYFAEQRYSQALKNYELAAPILQKMKSDQYRTVVERISSCREVIKQQMEQGSTGREEQYVEVQI